MCVISANPKARHFNPRGLFTWAGCNEAHRSKERRLIFKLKNLSSPQNQWMVFVHVAPTYFWPILLQGYHGQWKVREKRNFFKVREKSGKFISFWILWAPSHKNNEKKLRTRKAYWTCKQKTKKYAKHVIFLYKLLCVRLGKSQGILFVLMHVWQHCIRCYKF